MENQTLMVGSPVILCMGCRWATKIDHQTQSERGMI